VWGSFSFSVIAGGMILFFISSTTNCELAKNTDEIFLFTTGVVYQ
jgi:hypothetical protein